MEIIRHRVNRIEELKTVDPNDGLEFDIRSRDGKMILAHDPYQEGELLEPYLEAAVRSGPERLFIFNPKEDGLEGELLRLVARCRIRRFFFLDLALPTLVRLAVREGVGDVAVRVSEYEPIEGALRFKGLARWVWLDSFNGEPPSRDLTERLKPHFKICLVSPELEGYPADRITDYRPLIPFMDAVCTHNPDRWH